jgi:hypothetical protein
LRVVMNRSTRRSSEMNMNFNPNAMAGDVKEVCSIHYDKSLFLSHTVTGNFYKHRIKLLGWF